VTACVTERLLALLVRQITPPPHSLAALTPHLTPHLKQTQVLQLVVMDEDLIGGGKVMGVTQLPLRDVSLCATPQRATQPPALLPGSGSLRMRRCCHEN
jgi:hypothetical protein